MCRLEALQIFHFSELVRTSQWLQRSFKGISGYLVLLIVPPCFFDCWKPNSRPVLTRLYLYHWLQSGHAKHELLFAQLWIFTILPVAEFITEELKYRNKLSYLPLMNHGWIPNIRLTNGYFLCQRSYKFSMVLVSLGLNEV